MVTFNRVLVALFLFSGTLAYGQKGKVKTAQKELLSGNLELAIAAIEEASRHPKTTQLPNTWNVYFSICEEKLKVASTTEDSLMVVGKLVGAYEKCIEYDTDYAFSPDLTPKITTIFNDFGDLADYHYSKESYERFIMLQMAYLKCGEVLNAELGSEYHKLAMAAEKVDNSPLAIEYYLKSIRSGMYETESYMSLHQLYKAEGSTKKADSVLLMAFFKYPNHLALANRVIQESIDNTMYFMARQHANRALSYNPNEPELHYKLGLINKKLGLPEDAVRSFSKALSLDSKFYKAAYEVGSYYANIGLEENNERLLDVARRYLEVCENQLDDNNKVLVLLRELYLQLRDFENYERINSLIEG